MHSSTTTMAAAAAPTRVRVYVGGLPADATTKELSERFSRFVAAESCRLESVELLPPKGLFALNSDATHRGFAYLTLSGEAASAATEKLVKTYNKTKWRGSVLRVELAKPDYLEKLQLEWQEQREQRAKQSAAIAEAHGLVAVASDREPLGVCVGGVAFCGTKRTTFDYANLDLDAAFARKAPVAAVKAPVAVAAPGDATETEGSDSDDAQGDEEEGDDDDADYWATSGDESEQETSLRPAPVANTPPITAQATETSSSSSSSSSSRSESEAESADSSGDDEDKEDAAASDDEDHDAVAMDDVEAFVQQILDEEEDAATASAATKAPDARTRGGDGVSADPAKQREEANARRIAALEAKRKQQQQALAATKIDLSAKANNTKITFDDSGNEREAGESDAERDGAAITNWLDSSDDEDADEQRDFSELRDGSDHDDEDAVTRRRKRNALDFAGAADDDDDVGKAFAVRPEFLGARGKKLFELQKRFGGDQRFRMDARFIDDEENEYGGTDGLVLDGDDDDDETAMANGPAGELQSFQQEVGADEAAAHEREWMAEQDAALSVIATIFPDVDVESIKYRLRVKVKKDPIKEAAWMGQLKRYDPRNAHARHEFELPMDNDAKATASSKGARAGDTSKPSDESAAASSARETKDVLIGGDRFFETSSSLGSLFTRVRKNSEDGIAGEAALDGVFGAGRSGISDSASGDADETAQGAGAATFKLSSLFDFQIEDDASAKPSRLAAMGETLFEANDDDDESGEKPWHFTQSFFSDDKDEDVAMDTDQDDDDHEDDDEEDAADASGDAKTAKKALKKSLTEFLAFGEAFGRDVAPPKASEWTERRKKLTMDYKRKRKDALRSKKKLQQRLQKQHKKQKTAARA